jgi:hypothetical protein
VSGVGAIKSEVIFAVNCQSLSAVRSKVHRAPFDVKMYYGNEVKTTSVFNGFHQVKKISFFSSILINPPPHVAIVTINKPHLQAHIAIWTYDGRTKKIPNVKRRKKNRERKVIRKIVILFNVNAIFAEWEDGET